MLTNSASNSRQDFELYFTGGTASQSAARPLVILIHGLTASPAEMLSLGNTYIALYQLMWPFHAYLDTVAI
jgi:hypothetical protein